MNLKRRIELLEQEFLSEPEERGVPLNELRFYVSIIKNHEFFNPLPGFLQSGLERLRRMVRRINAERSGNPATNERRP